MFYSLTKESANKKPGKITVTKTSDAAGHTTGNGA